MFDGLTAVGGDDGKMAEIPGIWEIASNSVKLSNMESVLRTIPRHTKPTDLRRKYEK